MLNLEHVREQLGAGFQPFTIHLSDGRSFEVPHSDFIAVGRGFLIVIDDKNRSHKLDALHIISLDDVRSDDQSPAAS